MNLLNKLGTLQNFLTVLMNLFFFSFGFNEMSDLRTEYFILGLRTAKHKQTFPRIY